MEEVIQYWKKELNCFNYTKDLDLAQDNYFGQFEEQINMISRTLNELEKLQKENKINNIKNEILNGTFDHITFGDYVEVLVNERYAIIHALNENNKGFKIRKV